jgi:hypothetical protein
MATTLNAGTTAATALNITTDTTGAMAIQTSGTTAIAISSAQAVTLTNALGVTSGGTGVTTSTGSGSNVLSTSPTLVTPVLGTPASGNLANCTFPNLTVNTTGSAGSIANTGGWAITPSGTKLYFSYNGTNVASMDSSGNFKSLLTTAAGTTP